MTGSSKDQSHVVASTTELTMVTLGTVYTSIDRESYTYSRFYGYSSPRSPHSEPSEPSKPSVGDLGALGAVGALGARSGCLESGMLGNLTEDSHAACLLPAGKGCGISPLLQLYSSDCIYYELQYANGGSRRSLLPYLELQQWS